ncbi:hypothetical protein [Nocardioides caldifontis]|uniref:hypothetical protein n=1 Tax=Nocardioides caldifontis TaxID=2588938 RepID=UPI0011DF544A|nr:hypothetical protein [Nocardioides caldifontis]
MAEAQTSKYPYFGVPPARQPRPATTEPALTGKRVILSTPEGFVYDMRAATEVAVNTDGSATIEICSEAAWYVSGGSPHATWPAHLVWIE